MDTDDILSQLLNSLGTEDSNAQKIEAFITVLACTTEEASFFLESAQWSVEAAVGLWLESGQDHRKRSRYAGNGGHAFGSFLLPEDLDVGGYGGHNGAMQRATSGGDMSGTLVGSLFSPGKYVKRQLVIEGLDPAWTAWVSRSTGEVYFRHDASGHQQRAVPPGFADDTSASDGDGGGGGGGGGGALRKHPGTTHTNTDAGWVHEVTAGAGAGSGSGSGGGGIDEDLMAGMDDGATDSGSSSSSSAVAFAAASSSSAASSSASASVFADGRGYTAHMFTSSSTGGPGPPHSHSQSHSHSHSSNGHAPQPPAFGGLPMSAEEVVDAATAASMSNAV